MALRAVNEGETQMLRYITGNEVFADGDTLILRLYDTDVTPAEGDTFSDYTESTGSGYSNITLESASWSFAEEAGDTVHADYAQQTFTYSGSDVLYGYYITSKDDVGDPIVLWAEKFTDGPYTIPGGGGTVKVTPYIILE